ncbi:protein NDNF-like [Agrilus planipennis]|uniref:Protein NDNF n=1 Tax=Agrilus planipennis TaxID=224129 RepID=A0A1W4WJ85_AGRPL|nr:protein NDNF-like [Agrilus planipennis]
MNLGLVTILIFGVFHTESEGLRRSKKTRQLKSLLPQYEPFLSTDLPNDKQISVFLKKGITKTLLYKSQMDGIPLTFTVATCTSPVNWVVIPKSRGDSIPLSKPLVNITTMDTDTFELESSFQTVYSFEIVAVNEDTFVHVYLSTEPGGPQAIKTSQNLGMKLTRRQRRKQLTISWEPSLVDPQSTVYCVVVNTKKHYRTLCSAQGEKYGFSTQKPTPASQTLISWIEPEKHANDLAINCVGHHTHYTAKNMVEGLKYYFDLFAVNQQSNLTYHRGSSYLTFNKNFKPTALKDGKLSFVNLKKYDGKVTFRFKMRKIINDSLKFYVVPCGGSVDIEISTKGQVVFTRRRVERFDKIVIENPEEGLRYYIKIMSTNRDELRRISGVEILATTRPLSSIPLPDLPSDLTVEEFSSLRQCNSVTIGWIPSTESDSILYCVNIKQIRFKELEMYEVPNQCITNGDKRAKKSKENTTKYCKDIKNFQENVLTQTIKKLKPGRNYEVQVTARKRAGKELSYNLLYVKTKPFCERSNKTRLKSKARKENTST